MTDAIRVLDEAIARAPEPRLKARAQVERELVRLETETSVGTGQARLVTDAVLPVLEREGDEYGQCRVWLLRAQAAWIAGRVGGADAAWRRAADCATRAGDERELFGIVGWRATAAVFGPTPVDDAIRLCEEFRELVRASPVWMASMINPLASLHAMKGEFELADRLLAEANETLHQLGSLGGSVNHHEALVRLLAGQPALAERPLRAGVATLASMNDSALLATTNAMLAQAVYAQGRLREADELCREAAVGGRRRRHRDPGDLARRQGEGPRPRGQQRAGRGARTRSRRADRADRLALTPRRCDARSRRGAPDVLTAGRVRPGRPGRPCAVRAEGTMPSAPRERGRSSTTDPGRTRWRSIGTSTRSC